MTQEEDDFYVKMDAAFMETAAVSHAYDLRRKRYVFRGCIVATIANLAAALNTTVFQNNLLAIALVAGCLGVVGAQGSKLLWSWLKVKRLERKNLIMFRDGMMERMGEAPTPFEFHAEMRKFKEFSMRKMREREGDRNGA